MISSMFTRLIGAIARPATLTILLVTGCSGTSAVETLTVEEFAYDGSTIVASLGPCHDGSPDFKELVESRIFEGWSMECWHIETTNSGITSDWFKSAMLDFAERRLDVLFGPAAELVVEGQEFCTGGEYSLLVPGSCFFTYLLAGGTELSVSFATVFPPSTFEDLQELGVSASELTVEDLENYTLETKLVIQWKETEA